jgi:branched-chain amino acid transport system ATP-binding protein
MKMMLKVDNLVVSYGGIEALKGASIEVEEGKIVTLVGANGAGKSTMLRSIVGLVKPKNGTINYDDKNLLLIKPHNIVRQGITLVPEGRRIFPDLTVLENIKLGAFSRKDEKKIKEDMEWVHDLFPRLEERSWQQGGTLSGGEQQMLAIGRALMSRPKLLMMDEPSLGLAPLIIKDLFNIIKKINKQGVTILLIEQNANAALHIADIGYVMETGRITIKGTGKELLNNEDVKKAYLGESVHA